MSRQIALIVPSALVVILVNAYFVAILGLRQFYELIVGFSLKYYRADTRWNTWQAYLSDRPPFDLHRLKYFVEWWAIYSLFPWIFLIFFAFYWRSTRSGGEKCGIPDSEWQSLVLLNLIGLALFASVSYAPAFDMACFSALPGFIVAVWFASLIAGRFRPILIGLTWSVGILSLVRASIITQMHPVTYLETPSGQVAFEAAEDYALYAWFKPRLRPAEYLFRSSGPDLNFYFDLSDPTSMQFLTFTDYTRPEQVQSVIEGLERHEVRFVLWWTYMEGPGSHSRGDHLDPLREYLRAHYRQTMTFSRGPDALEDQLWERIAAAKP